METECKKCGYIWNYKGEHQYWITCPRCLTKIKSPLKNEN